MFNEEKNERHNVTIDAMSLLDSDAVDNTMEDAVFSSITLTSMIRSLTSPLDKFVIISIIYGFKKNEIGFMLKIDPSTVTRIHQSIQVKLRRRFPDNTEEVNLTLNEAPKSERETIIDFFKTIYPNDPAIKRLK